MTQVVEKLRAYILCWKAYFKLAQTPDVWPRLDEWLRHWLGAIQPKHWKRGITIHRELLRLGAAPLVAYFGFSCPLCRSCREIIAVFKER